MNKVKMELVLDAISSLGSALADHWHTWSQQERTAYEKAVRILKAAIASDDCKETD